MNEMDLSELMDVAREGYLFDFAASTSPSLFVRSPAGDTLLHVAAARGSIGEIDFLLKMGLDVNSIGDYGATPLHCAAMTEQSDAYRHLVIYGADPAIRDSSGFLASDLLGCKTVPPGA